jgi:hypothetical protein
MGCRGSTSPTLAREETVHRFASHRQSWCCTRWRSWWLGSLNIGESQPPTQVLRGKRPGHPEEAASRTARRHRERRWNSCATLRCSGPAVPPPLSGWVGSRSSSSRRRPARLPSGCLRPRRFLGLSLFPAGIGPAMPSSAGVKPGDRYRHHNGRQPPPPGTTHGRPAQRAAHACGWVMAAHRPVAAAGLSQRSIVPRAEGLPARPRTAAERISLALTRPCTCRRR